MVDNKINQNEAIEQAQLLYELFTTEKYDMDELDNSKPSLILDLQTKIMDEQKKILSALSKCNFTHLMYH